jgi:glycine cleavage system aminomethyltransferase T
MHYGPNHLWDHANKPNVPYRVVIEGEEFRVSDTTWSGNRGWELLLSTDDSPNCRMVTLARCSASKVKEVKFYTSGESVEFYYRQG